MNKIKVIEKDISERIADVKEIYSKLESIGIHKRFELMDPFYEDINLFVKEGKPFSGKIVLSEISYILHYQLITRRMSQSIVWLKYIGKKKM
jgi:hypothetical protein